ncbi:MAG: hypothetical protein WD691_08230 [Acidimicrobiales bacterium]
MARQNRLTSPLRVLGLCLLGLLFGGATAIADGALRPAEQATASDQLTAQALEGSIASVVAPVTSVAPATTVAPAPTTTAAPATTTTAAPAPTTTAAPAHSHAPAPAPAPAPAKAAAQPQQQHSDPAARVQATFESQIPAAWRSAIKVKFQLIDGNTSWAQHDGTIQIGSVHYNGPDSLLKATIAHEFGHLIAFEYGSQKFNGAAPEGWPSYSNLPEEAWADCVSRAFTGINDPSHGLPDCAGNSLSWTSNWVGSGPGSHEHTGW